jgi:hypothetical protein
VYRVDTIDERNPEPAVERVALEVVNHVGPLGGRPTSTVRAATPAAKHRAKPVRGDVVLVPDVAVGNLSHLAGLLTERQLRKTVRRRGAPSSGQGLWRTQGTNGDQARAHDEQCEARKKAERAAFSVSDHGVTPVAVQASERNQSDSEWSMKGRQPNHLVQPDAA